MPRFELLLNAKYQFLPKTNSTRASVVMDQFGINFEQGEHVIADNIPFTLNTSDIVLFIGESGSGKSSLMRSAAKELANQQAHVLSLDDLQWEERALVEQLPCSTEEALSLLAMCGLGEAQLMLRTPSELSDGQRFRFLLAFALAHHPDWVVVDEFTSTLDRRLARVIAANLRRISARIGTGFLLATTHDDIASDVDADCLVQCRLDGEIQLTRQAEASPNTAESGLKKKELPTSTGFPPRPNPTGRTSLGGIIAATTSG
ncbi:ATP-binding cassette domain-containing protein [Planctomicrobium sp. SH527]|uniref:ATP-binding cassette domain-containing protein n=1 Tax=Planctomicrobium sp. SH527 TaxID=3448123 RepID=UPI003F5B5D34